MIDAISHVADSVWFWLAVLLAGGGAATAISAKLADVWHRRWERELDELQRRRGPI